MLFASAKVDQVILQMLSPTAPEETFQIYFQVLKQQCHCDDGVHSKVKKLVVSRGQLLLWIRFCFISPI